VAALRSRWVRLGVVFIAVFVAAAWYFSGVFVDPEWGVITTGPADSAPGVDWGRVLAAAAVVAMLATGIVGVLVRLARP
jgi:hypothetical protein